MCQVEELEVAQVSWIIRSGPQYNHKCLYKRCDTARGGGSSVITEAEIRAVCYKPRDMTASGSQKRQGTGFLLRTSGRGAGLPMPWFQPCDLDFRRLASSCVRWDISVLLNHPGCGNLSQQP